MSRCWSAATPDPSTRRVLKEATVVIARLAWTENLLPLVHRICTVQELLPSSSAMENRKPRRSTYSSVLLSLDSVRGKRGGGCDGWIDGRKEGRKDLPSMDCCRRTERERERERETEQNPPLAFLLLLLVSSSLSLSHTHTLLPK